MNPKGPPKARFEQIFAQGSRWNGDTLRISALPGSGLVGIATSKKIGEKPMRTRLKRRLREAWRASAPLDEWDTVIIGGQRAYTAPYSDLVQEVDNLKKQVIEQSGP